MRKDFAVFILTHGRPDNVKTLKTLNRLGYTGTTYLIVDNEDKSKEAYKAAFGDRVIIFDKIEAAKITDSADNQGSRRGVLYARNYSFKIAEDLGIKYFVQLDDDYDHFQFRFNCEFDYEPKVIKNLDSIFSAFVTFIETTPTTTVAMAQGGDFIGGSGNRNGRNLYLSRKAMNSFFCATDRPFKFFGRINEDVTSYVTLGSTGSLFFTSNQVSLEQTQTQTNKGGLTEIYLDLGTYVKSFYSVLYRPSCVKVKAMGDRGNYRLHHAVNWSVAVPKILRESVKKPAC